MHRNTFWIFFLVAGLLLPSPTRADHLRILAEEYPPYAFEHEGEPSGFTVEIVQEILRRTGRDPHDMDFMPWARAVQTLGSAHETILFPVPATPQLSQRFRLVGPIFLSRITFFKRAGSDVTINTLQEAMRVQRISVTRQDPVQRILEERGFTNLEESNGHRFNFAKLEAGRVALAATDQRLFPAFLKQNRALLARNFENTDIEVARLPMTIAFTSDIEQQLVDLWQSTLEAMKRDGSYTEILNRYIENDLP